MKHILLIEDDLFISDITSKKLSQNGFAVSSVKTADEASAVLSAKNIDLIVLDLDLPGTHGSVYLKELKNNVTTSNIPIIVFSNSDTPEIEMSCIAAGADAFFVKINTDIDELQEKINTLLHISK